MRTAARQTPSHRRTSPMDFWPPTLLSRRTSALKIIRLIRSRKRSHQLCCLVVANSERARIPLSLVCAEAKSAGGRLEAEVASSAKASRKSRAWFSCNSRTAGSFSAWVKRELSGDVDTSYCCSPVLTVQTGGRESRYALRLAEDFRAVS